MRSATACGACGAAAACSAPWRDFVNPCRAPASSNPFADHVPLRHPLNSDAPMPEPRLCAGGARASGAGGSAGGSGAGLGGGAVASWPLGGFGPASQRYGPLDGIAPYGPLSGERPPARGAAAAERGLPERPPAAQKAAVGLDLLRGGLGGVLDGTAAGRDARSGPAASGAAELDVQVGGRWRTADGRSIAIDGCTVYASQGQRATLRPRGPGRFVLDVGGGPLCEGRLSEDGHLLWRDGDVWHQEANSAPRFRRGGASESLEQEVARGAAAAAVAASAPAAPAGVALAGWGRAPPGPPRPQNWQRLQPPEPSWPAVLAPPAPAATPARAAVAAAPAARAPAAIVAKLQEMFPSWDAESLGDALASADGDLEAAANTLLQWTAECAATPAATGCGAFATPRNSACRSAGTLATAATVSPWGGDRVLPLKPRPDISSTPRTLPRATYDRVLAARLERKYGGRHLAQVLKAATLWRRWARVGTPRQGASSARALGAAPGARPPAAGFGLEEEPASGTREDQIQDGKILLRQRCSLLGLRQVWMEEDGNCQFRALSQELYSTQQQHLRVHEQVVAHMQRHAGEYRALFPPGEWDAYVAQLAKTREWGDELTLRAAADAFGVKIHVITSTRKHWYLLYGPGQPKGPGSQGPVRELFLTYVASVHNNTVQPLR